MPRHVVISLTALVACVGCRTTTVVAAPHAGPGESSAGLVIHRGLGTEYVSVGVVAVNDGRHDVSWETRRGGTELWACWTLPEGGAAPVCRRARFEESEVPKKAIGILAPPIARASTASPGFGATRGEDPKRDIAVPNHGIWVAGQTRFLEHGLFHCIVGDQGPHCDQVMTHIIPMTAHSRHLVHWPGDVVDDVTWVGPSSAVMARCGRRGAELWCQPIQFD